MYTTDKRAAPFAARFRCFVGCPSGLARIVPLAFMVVLVVSSAFAQSTSTGQSAKDSTALHRSAVAAVNAYEVAAFHYWPSSARPCVVGSDNRDCAGGWCEPTAGRGSCVMGRVVPCPFYSSVATRPFCDADAATLGAAHRTRDSVQIVAIRDTLFRTLASVGDKLPGDSWVVGQRLYYLLALGKTADALRSIGNCHAEAAWCELLAGYVHARSGGVDAAAVSFENAEHLLTPEARCDWVDISALLSAETSKTYEAMPCGSAARGAFEARFWWLSDPSWLIAGNDRRTEHMARKVEDRLLTDWLNALCDSCVEVRGASVRPTIVTNDAEMIRTGPNDSWWIQSIYGSAGRGARGGRAAGGRGGGRGGAGTGAAGGSAAGGRGGAATGAGRAAGDSTPAQRGGPTWLSPSVVRRSTAARFHFVPVDHALTSPMAASGGDWRPIGGPTIGVSRLVAPDDSVSRTPIPERFTPRYAASVVPVSHWQAGFVRRGDSASIVAAFDLSEDAALRSMLTAPGADMMWTSGIMGFAHLNPDGGVARDSFMVQREGVPPVRWSAAISAPWDSVILGFEALGERQGPPQRSAAPASILARARFGIAPPTQLRQRVQLSDLFLVDSISGTPAAMDAPTLARRLRVTTIVDSGSTVGLYWEAYGVKPGDKAKARIEVVQLNVRRGRLQGISRGIVGGNDVVIDNQWNDPGTVDPARSYALSLKSLVPGDYDVRLSLSTSGQKPVAVTRRITVATR